MCLSLKPKSALHDSNAQMAPVKMLFPLFVLSSIGWVDGSACCFSEDIQCVWPLICPNRGQD